jgi:hypothetical protein
MEGAGVRGNGALLTGRTVGVGTTDGGVSIRSGREASRCKEKAGWILKIVGDEESAREMCKDIEDKSSSGIIAETLNRIIVRKMTEGEKATTYLIGWVSDVLGRGNSLLNHADEIRGVSMAKRSSCCKLGDAWVKIAECDECGFGTSSWRAASESIR